MWLPAVALLAISGSAMASVPGPNQESVRIEVSFADLDLDKAAGIETLYKRLRSAAAGACGPRSLTEAGSVRQVSNNKACFKDLLDRAVRKADNAALTRRHSG
jgi:UrcA family protein